MVNVIIEEYLYTLQFHKVTHDKSDVMVKVYDGFSCPTIGPINLYIEVGTKSLDVNLVVIPTFNQLHWKLGHP